MTTISARRIALDILAQVSSGRKTLDQRLEEAEPLLASLHQADRSLVHALVFGVLRWQNRLDHLIDRRVKRPQKVDPTVRIILRMALFQIHHLDRVPDSAAVHTAVEMTKQSGRGWAAGFVNGVLRRSLDDRTPQWPDIHDAPDLAVAVRHAIPQWLARRWIERYGAEETIRLCRTINTIPDLTLRTNTLKTDRPRLIDAVQDHARRIEPTRYSPEGVVLSGPRYPLPQWPAFQKGWFQVQDEAAQLVARFLAPMPGEIVWDACAGLGTKTAHMAQLMADRGVIWSTDLHAHKLDRLQDEMQRLGITLVRRRRLDLTATGAMSVPPVFDRILLDAPCSGLGVLQKNPDGKWRVHPDDLRRNGLRQLAMLENVHARLRPGGVLVYAVCSFEPEENEAVVKAFLQKHPDFVIHRPELTSVAQSHHLLTPEGWLKCLPHRHGMDGFFAAAFIRKRW